MIPSKTKSSWPVLLDEMDEALATDIILSFFLDKVEDENDEDVSLFLKYSKRQKNKPSRAEFRTHDHPN